MIQRIQTFYLLVAEILIGTLFVSPFGKLVDKAGADFTTDLLGVHRIGANSMLLQSNMFLTILGVVILILILVTIIRYKARNSQQKIAFIVLFSCLVLAGFMFLNVRAVAEQMVGLYTLNLAFIFPIIAAVLTLMAIRGIRKDEALVRSIDRIR